MKRRLAVAGFLLIAGTALAADVPRLETFRRPATTPFPNAASFTPAKAALGKKLFFDPILSGANDRSCAFCHQPERGFASGKTTGLAIDGSALPRAVPTILNTAWAPRLFWDGRAESLEAQALGPVANPAEMNQNLDELVRELRAHADYPQLFRNVFPDQPEITTDTIAQALAVYERTLVSGNAPFDRFANGQTDALTPAQQRGFRLFTGKARCATCHSGWAFTDNAFHDIGLPGEDRGRGKILDLPKLDHAFKTPTLRDLSQRGPFMHDNSIATLEGVIEHYVKIPVRRPSLSPDLKTIALTRNEKADLLAFLKSLDADGPPPSFVPETVGLPRAVETRSVSQKDKEFWPTHIAIAAGDKVLFRNDDTRAHNIRVNDAALNWNSGLQEPGEDVEIPFATPGRFDIFCGIHPTMKLRVEVADTPK
jgi:cytochrome c peroxidase